MGKIEYIDVLNEDGSSANYAVSRQEVHAKGLWHRVVHVWLIDSKGNLLIQKRSDNKESFPSTWDISSAGHIESGMTSRETAIKELFEELGILKNDEDLEYLFNAKKMYVQQNGKYLDNEFADIYLIHCPDGIDLDKIVLQKEEVSDVKLIHHHLLFQMAKEGDPTFVPLFHRDRESFEQTEYYRFFKLLEKRFPTCSSSPFE
eukprot:gene1998-2460_t